MILVFKYYKNTSSINTTNINAFTYFYTQVSIPSGCGRDVCIVLPTNILSNKHKDVTVCIHKKDCTCKSI